MSELTVFTAHEAGIGIPTLAEFEASAQGQEHMLEEGSEDGYTVLLSRPATPATVFEHMEG